MSTEWRPQYSAQEYQEKISKKGEEIMEHANRMHNGVIVSTCDRCASMSSTVRDWRILLNEAIEFEKKIV